MSTTYQAKLWFGVFENAFTINDEDIKEDMGDYEGFLWLQYSDDFIFGVEVKETYDSCTISDIEKLMINALEKFNKLLLSYKDTIILNNGVQPKLIMFLDSF